MIKSYEGYALPSDQRVSYQLEFRCPLCDSEDVELDIADPIPEFCDGSPSTADELVHWTCNACKHRAIGQDFARGVVQNTSRSVI